MSRILVVDDSAETCRLYATVLARAGYTAVTCSACAELPSRLADGPFTLAIVDLLLPTTADGEEAIRVIKSADPSLPVMVISGFVPAGTDLSAVARKHGVELAMRKGAGLEALLAGIRLLSGHEDAAPDGDR